MLRVLIADDSLTVRKTVAEKLREGGFDVVGEAVNGREAVALTHRLEPDVILMDVVMPGMDGLEATRQIMQKIPTPVVILSAHASRDEVFKTYDALAAGALEVCSKPRSEGHLADLQWQVILMTTRAAAEVAVIRFHDRNTANANRRGALAYPLKNVAGSGSNIIAIGASTGGPAAIKQVLASLPSDFDIPIILALHCNPDLASSLAGWFARDCALPVADAVDNQALNEVRGTVITIPTGYHLRVQNNRTMISPATEINACSPSVDILFESLADDQGDKALGILLTGMGDDGAAGLKRIRECGGRTIAQDEESCVVFGMPGAAISAGAAEFIAALNDIAALLLGLTVRGYKVDTA